MSRPKALPALAAALALALAALLAAGCGPASTTGTTPLRIRFWHAMAGPLGKALRQIVDRFHQERPDLEVEPIFQGGYPQLSQKVNLSLLDGSPPEMAQMYENAIAFCNRREPTILVLDPLIEADPRIAFDDLFPAFRKTVLLDGKVCSFPPTKSFPVLYCNAALLRSVGATRPPTTWAEVKDLGGKLTKDLDGDGAPDRWGYAFTNDPWPFECMVLQEGGSFLRPDGGAAMGGAPARAAMLWLLDAVGAPRPDGVKPAPFAYRTSGFDHQLDFAEGRVAMIVGSSVSRQFMEDQIDFETWIAPIPQGTHKASVMAGPNVAIFAAVSKQRQKAAWDFLEFFTRTEVTLFWGIATNYLPVRRSALEHPTFRHHLEADPGFGAGVAQLDYAVSEPPLPGWFECRQILNNMMQKIFQDPARLDPLLAEGVADMDRALAEDRKNRGL